MARQRSLERLDRIVEAGLEHFLRKGYRGTRIDEIAEDAGVSAGSVYNYCTSKESLFDLCLSRGLGNQELPTQLPHDVLPSTNVIERAWDRFQASTRFEILAAVREGRAAGVYSLEEITEALYDWLDTNGRGIRLIERCARDWPELDHYYQAAFRGPGFAALTEVVEAERAAGRVSAAGPADITARIVVELCAYFAMHRRKDRLDLGDRDDEVRATVLEFIRLALSPVGVEGITT